MQKTNLTVWLIALLFFVSFASRSAAQSSGFTYQGRLTDGGTPPTGTYDFQFKLYDALENGNQLPIGSPVTVTKSAVLVTNGVFTVQLDFGASGFPGADRFLDIGVKHPADGSYTPLSPRQQVTAAPYALRTLTATSADALSGACTLCVTNAQIQAVDGSKVTGTVANAANAANATTAGNVSGVVAIANGGTGSSTQNFVDLATNQNNIAGNKSFTGSLTVDGGSVIVGGINPLLVDPTTRSLYIANDGGSFSNNFRLDGFENHLYIVARSSPPSASGAGIVFRTATAGFGETDRMGITPEGNVGIGGTAMAKLDITGGANFDGTNDPKAIALSFRTGGFRHWIRTRHNPGAVAGNAIDFFVNNSSVILGSRGPGEGSVHVMTLDNGNVGIGTTAPQSRLHVGGGAILLDNNQGLFIKSTTGTQKRALIGDASDILRIGSGGPLGFDEIRFDLGSLGDTAMTLSPSGDVGVGLTAPSHKLHVNGTVAGVGPYVDASDLRYKRDIRPIGGALSKVLSLRGVTFDWRRQEFPTLDFAAGRSVGFVAQEVEQVVPEAVTRDAAGFRSVAYSHLTPVLVEAVKEQQEQITAQQQTITELRRQNSALNTRLREQAARLDALERAASKSAQRRRRSSE